LDHAVCSASAADVTSTGNRLGTAQGPGEGQGGAGAR